MCINRLIGHAVLVEMAASSENASNLSFTTTFNHNTSTDHFELFDENGNSSSSSNWTSSTADSGEFSECVTNLNKDMDSAAADPEILNKGAEG